MGGKAKSHEAAKGSTVPRKPMAKVSKATVHAAKATKATLKATMICSLCAKKQAVADINIESTGKGPQDYLLVCQTCSS